MSKNQYGGNSAELFIDDYILTHKMRIPPELRLLLIKKLQEEENKLIAPILKEIKDNNIKDEDDVTYFKKLEKRKSKYEALDKNKPDYEFNTKEDIEIMGIHKKDVNGVVITDNEEGVMPSLPTRKDFI